MQKCAFQPRNQGEQSDDRGKQRQKEAVGNGIGAGKQVKSLDFLNKKFRHIVDGHAKKARKRAVLRPSNQLDPERMSPEPFFPLLEIW